MKKSVFLTIGYEIPTPEIMSAWTYRTLCEARVPHLAVRFNEIRQDEWAWLQTA